MLNTRSSFGVALLCSTSVLSLGGAARAQDQNGATAETIVVTGSRVIADAANSPTPLTIVTTAQLQATTPSGDITNALTKLPSFLGSNSSRTIGNAGSNTATDALNLRNLGAERTLVLFDGKRAVSSAQDNTVDVAALPQMLIQRVDVVTGGASAVYGSDAVTGVVNFVLDKHFTGWKVEANAGISNYQDGADYALGVAAGSDLFGGRGHIEGDLHISHQDAIPIVARPNTANTLTGKGTPASPYVYSQNVVDTTTAPGGKITCAGCAANGKQFIATDVIGPFVAGTPTGTGGLAIGGDGATHHLVGLTGLSSNEESFGRFSYNINDNTAFYVQVASNQAYTKQLSLGSWDGTGATPSLYYSNNAFLPPSTQALLADPSGTFTNNIIFENQGVAQGTNALVNTRSATAGLDGALGDYAWSVYYTHGDSRTKVVGPHNQNADKEWAANDAVAGPGGNPVCHVSTTSYAFLYPGCVPRNPFGPDALTSSQFNYFETRTQYIESDKLDDVGGSISGNVFDGWAGPVKAALSAESSWRSFSLISNASTGYVDCTGLRLCNPLTPLYGGTAINSVPEVSENVWEVAGEVNVPLLKNAPLVQDLSIDLAGRYADYSISGSAETWKIGLDYHLNDQVRFRATNSIDIRAPNLYELYEPISDVHGAINDPHTNSSPGISNRQQGNANLTPEVGRTYSAGVVFTPDFAPGLTASIDYYHISMTNVVGVVNGTSAVILNLCEATNNTAAFCSLIQRPLPFSNRTTANIPTLVLSEALNIAWQRTEGWDLELDYGFKLGDVWEDAPGSVNLRMLANIAPVMESLPFPGSPVAYANIPEVIGGGGQPVSKGHVSSFVSYNVGSWAFNLTDRWIAGYPNPISYGIVYTQPRVNSVNYQDITIDKKFTVDDRILDGYLTVENAGNILPPLALTNNTTKPQSKPYGITGTTEGAYDLIGRFFTIGVRAAF